MSTQVFPTIPSIEFPEPRSPQWNTHVVQNVSGKETRVTYESSPRYQWDMSFSLLRSAIAFAELQQLMGFFNSRQGMFDSFLFTDPDDNSVTSQGIATGDGTTKAFQLVRAFGGFVEPILAPNVVSAVYLAGVSIPTAGLSAPTNGTLTQTAAGALAATTYYVQCTWTTGSGETLASTETNLAVSANNVLNVAHPGSPPTGATGWNVYVSNTGGGGSTHETRQNGGTPIALASNWVEPTTGLVAGTALPSGNTTGWSVSTWGSTTPGVLTFTGAPALGVAVTADFTYYFPVRFVDDSITFNRFMYQMYENKKVSIISIK